jgi:hypothetical protein
VNIKDDVLIEGRETATFSISNPSPGIVLGAKTSRDVAISDNDLCMISGTVLNDHGNPMSGVTITFRHNGSTVTTNASGYYIMKVPFGKTTTFVPSLAAYTFEPANITLKNITSHHPNQNFTGHEIPCAKIGDLIWYDTNGNGVHDINEVGIAGVELKLKDKNSHVIAEAVTGITGRYVFENLLSGTYFIHIQFHSLPANYTLTTNNDPLKVYLAAGTYAKKCDFGFWIAPRSIGDCVWSDINKNGIRESSETGLPNITVVLSDSIGGHSHITSTDANGSYRFTGLSAGIYMVSLDANDPDLPSKFVLTTHNSPVRVDLIKNKQIDQIDFGFARNAGFRGTLGGYIWHDANWDRILQQSETNLPFAQIDLYRLPGNSSESVLNESKTIRISTSDYIGTLKSDFFGRYIFTELPAGTYLVEASSLGPDPVGVWTLTSQGSARVLLTKGEARLDVDFGYAYPSEAIPGSIKGLVFEDLNANHSLESSEPGLAGINVILKSENVEISRMVTEGSGQFRFESLPPGDYQIGCDPSSVPEGLALTTWPGSYSVFLPANGLNQECLFGFFKTRPWGISRESVLARYEPGFGGSYEDFTLHSWSSGVFDTSMIGFYNGLDSLVQDYEIMTAWASGIDGFVVNWYGKDSFENTVAMGLLDRADQLYKKYHEYGFDFEIAMAYEELNENSLDSNFVYLSGSVLVHKAYWGTRRETRRPLFIQNSIENTLILPEEYSDCADTTLPADCFFLWNGVDPEAFGSMQVCYPEIQPTDSTWDPSGLEWGDAYLHSAYARLNRLPNPGEQAFMMGVVWPGYDDRQWQGTRDHWIDRRDTLVYAGTWGKVHDYVLSDYGRPMPWCLVESWNDFNQGTAIEPGNIWQYKYDAMTRDHSRWFKVSIPSDSVGVENLGLLVPRHVYQARIAMRQYPEKADEIGSAIDQAIIRFFEKEYLESISLLDRAIGLIPSSVSVSAVTDTTASIHWGKVGGANAYQIFVSTDLCSFEPWIGLSPDRYFIDDSDTAFVLEGLESDTDYYLSVVPADSNLDAYANYSWYMSEFSDARVIHFRTSLSDSIETVVPDGFGSGLPSCFVLEQNVPNPFNPATEIRYALPEKQKVSIRIYDVLGRQVEWLVNQVQEAGYYTVSWDASQLTTGVYFFRIDTEKFSAVRKMMVIK